MKIYNEKPLLETLMVRAKIILKNSRLESPDKIFSKIQHRGIEGPWKKSTVLV